MIRLAFCGGMTPDATAKATLRRWLVSVDKCVDK